MFSTYAEGNGSASDLIFTTTGGVNGACDLGVLGFAGLGLAGFRKI
jgi:hypothetical protein